MKKQNFLSAKNIVIMMTILLISISIVYSTAFTFSAPTANSKVKAGATDIVLYQFVLNNTDSTIVGAAPAAGTVITDTTPWIAVYFYDNGNSNWDSNADWIGLDPDQNEIYTSEADIEVDCDGNTTTTTGECSSSPGDALTELINTDKICTDNLVNPTILFISNAGDCAFNDSNDIELLGSPLNITYTLVQAGDDWAYDGVGAYVLGDEVFIDVDGGWTYSDSEDTLIAGTAPAAESVINNTNQWTAVYFYDEGDALWNESGDWIGESEDGFYLDTLSSLLLNNTGTANESDIENVMIYNGSECSGSSAELVFNGSNMCPGGDKCWYNGAINMDLSGLNTFTICGDITAGAVNGNTLRMMIEQDNAGFSSGDTLPSGDESATGVITIDTANPTVTGVSVSIPMITDANAGSELNITLTFSEDMNMSIDLLPIGVTPDITGTVLSDCSSSGWASSTEYSYLCLINDTNEEFDEINLTVDAAEDEAGNLQTANTTVGLFAVDTKEPSISFITPTTAEGTFALDYIMANVSVTDLDLDSMTISLYDNLGAVVDSNYSSSGISPFFTMFTSLPSGTYYLNASANDTNGNINYTETLEIILDTTKPAPTGDYSVNLDEITIEDWGENFLFSFNWSESMNTSLDPTIGFTPNADAVLLGCSGSWEAADFYLYNCTINNSAVEIENINISINDGVDVLGNTQTDVYVFADVLSVDTILPSVSNVEVVPSYFNGSVYFIQSTNITISAEVSDSLGLNESSCEYSFNGTNGPWGNDNLVYNGTHCVFTGLAYTGTENEDISVYVEDNFENSQTDSLGPFFVDDDAPNTTSLGNGGTYTFGEWTQSNVSVSLTCSDELSGCSDIYYCQDSADACVPGVSYTVPVEITSEGTYYIRYSSIDNIGNTEAVQSVQIRIDVYPVSIGLISTGLDNFVCGGDSNGNVTVAINATDNVGVTYVAIDTSQINGSEGLINLTYNATSGLWETTFYLDDTSMYNFDSVEVTVLADDDAGRGIESWGNETPNFDLVLYSFTGPQMPDETCERQTALTTNFCNIPDFEHVNLINEVESNGSENCHGGQELPWGDDFQKVVTLNFTSVNFSDPSVGNSLANLQDALVAYITPPGQYGNSYIFVNASAFAELDTNATITLYGLPFTQLPNITTDGDGSAINVQTVINSPYLIEETCEDICEDWEADGYGNESECLDDCEPEDEFTMAVPNMDLTFTATSFSQYDMEDTENPIVEITEPSYGYSNGESIPVEFTANGTGTQLSAIYLYINGNAEYNWSYTGIFEECVNETPDMDVMTCSYELFDYTEGEINISVVAFDFGGDEPGNTGEDSMFVTIDQTVPSTAHDLVEGTWYNADFDITLTPTDTASGVNFTNYSVSGIVWNTGTTVSITDEGENSVYFYSVDNVGNTENVTNITALLDKTNPETNHSEVSAGWHKGLVITLTSEDVLSGVNTTFYSFTPAPEVWFEGNVVNMTETGTPDLFFYSEDNAGNEEDVQNITGIQIDLTEPETDITGDGGNYTFSLWNETTPIVMLNSSDAHSGVNTTLYCVDSENNCTPETVYNGTFLVNSNGTNFIRYMAIDNVNNEETMQIAKVLILHDEQIYMNNGSVDLNETDYVLIPEDYNTSTITVPNGMNATMDVVESLDMDTMNATLDGNITVLSNTSQGIVTVNFPAGLVISGEDTWTGEVSLPVIMPDDSVNVDPDDGKTATVSGVIEIGFGDSLLTFSEGVRINISGEAGKDVGYYRNSTFTKIDTECDGDNQTVGNALPAGGDCRIDVGNDLIIWTKHFTMFVTYEQEDVEDDDDNNGNGGATSQSCGAWSACVDGIQSKTCQGATTPYTVTRTCEGGEVSEEEPAQTSEESAEQTSEETGTTETSGSEDQTSKSEDKVSSEEETESSEIKGMNKTVITTVIIVVILVAAALVILSGKKKKN